MSDKAGFSEAFPYKGQDVAIEGSGDDATISIGDKKFSATRQAGMWRSEGVFNHYRQPGDLARHIVDYLHLFSPEG